MSRAYAAFFFKSAASGMLFKPPGIYSASIYARKAGSVESSSWEKTGFVRDRAWPAAISMAEANKTTRILFSIT